MPHVREVSSPATIKFQSHEIEELNPETGKIIRTRVIFPIIIPKEKEACISVPPLSAAKGQLNSLAPSPLATKSVDGNTSMITTLRGLPMPLSMPSADWVTPVPAATPTRDVTDSDDVRPSPPRTPMPPRWTPLTAPMPPIPSPVCDFRSSREETPIGLQADPSASTRPSSVSPRPFPEVTRQASPRDCEGEEGQFDDAEEGEPCTLQRLHPSEQPLPPTPSPSPMPSPASSQVDLMVQRILELKRFVAASPDVADTNVAADLPEAPLRLEGQGSTNETPMDTSVQGEEPNARLVNVRPPNIGRGTVIKQLFAPRGACTAPSTVCPPPVARKHAKELTALEPSTLPPLLPRMYIRPMTMDCGRLSPPSPAPTSVDSQDTKLQAALDQVTPAQARLSTFADADRQPTELTLPKP